MTILEEKSPIKQKLSFSKRINEWMKWLLPVFLIILIVISIISAIQSNTWVRDEMLEKQLSIAKVIGENIDFRFSLQQSFATSLITGIYPYITLDTQGGFEEFNSINRILGSSGLSAIESSVYKYRIYVPDDKNYSSQQDLFYPLSSMKADERLGFYYGKIGVSWVDDLELNTHLSPTEGMIGCVLTMAKKDNYNEIAGSIVVYRPISEIAKVLKLNTTKGEEILIVNASGRTIVDNAEDLSEKPVLNNRELSLVLSEESGSNSFVIDAELFAFCKLKAVDWYVVVRSQSSITQIDTPTTILRLLLWLLALLAICAAAMLIVTRYNEKLQIANYQMQALQAQIKPHFLYNTLDIIKWMVLGGYYTDSVETINELSRYLRMSISKTTNIVILRDEIELGKAYVKIIQKRFPSKFGFEIDADPDTLDCLLPKFVLQPILENSLTHGLLYCDKSDLLLTIRAWISDGTLNIQIEDNGMGMTAETLQLLKSGSIESKEGYGLKNTRQRLVLFNGSDTEFNVESRFGVGTCVTLGLKAARAERRK